MFKFEVGESYQFTYTKEESGEWGNEKTQATRLVFVKSINESTGAIRTFDYVKQEDRCFYIHKISKPQRLKQKAVGYVGIEELVPNLVDMLTDKNYYVFDNKHDSTIYAVEPNNVVDKYQLVTQGNGTVSIGPIGIEFNSNASYIMLYHKHGKFPRNRAPTGQDIINALQGLTEE